MFLRLHTNVWFYLCVKNWKLTLLETPAKHDHACNPSTKKAKTEKIKDSLRPAWATEKDPVPKKEKLQVQ